eukprot:scaffold153464_cov15-Prasinocladus_malaysianus.AAC.1
MSIIFSWKLLSIGEACKIIAARYALNVPWASQNQNHGIFFSVEKYEAGENIQVKTASQV